MGRSANGPELLGGGTPFAVHGPFRVGQSDRNTSIKDGDQSGTAYKWIFTQSSIVWVVQEYVC